MTPGRTSLEPSQSVPAMRPRRLRVLSHVLLLLAAAAVTLGEPPPLAATTLASTDPVVFAEVSEGAFVGRVIAVHTATPDGRVVTVARVAVVEAWGAVPAGGEIEVTSPGGRVGDLITHVPGAPRWNEGDALFAWVESDGAAWRPVALGWSVWTISAEERAEPMQPSEEAAEYPDLDSLRMLATQRFPVGDDNAPIEIEHGSGDRPDGPLRRP